MTVFLVALGAALGAPLRFLVDRVIQARHGTAFPWGTLAVNVAGSAMLGFLTGLPVSPAVAALAGSGFCGALTTYSTFSGETLRLVRDRAYFHTLTNIMASIVAGLGAAYCGLALARIFAG